MQTRLRKTGLAASIAIITLAVILAIGSTFSLFTSNDGNIIDVNSAKVEVTSELTGLRLYSLGEQMTGEKFANLGKAEIKGDDLEITNMTPGDEARVTVEIDNNSTVLIAYRVKVLVNGALYEGIDADNDDVADEAPLVITVKQGEKELALDGSYTEWAYTATIGADITDLDVSVLLPVEAGNAYQTKNATVELAVEAIQANAINPNVKTEEQLELALTYCDNITLADSFTLTKALVVTKPVTIDLAGNTLTLGGKPLTNEANLTIIDSGKQETASTESLAPSLSTTGKIDGEIINNGTLTLGGGTFVTLSNNEGATLTVNGSVADAVKNSGTATVSGATVESVENSGVMTVNSITASSITNTANGELTIKEATVNAIDDYAIVHDGAKLVIEGGTFTTTLGGEFPISASTDGVSIAGGNFSADLPADNNLCEDGYTFKKDGDMYVIVPAVASVGSVYYASLEEALEAAAENGTVTILLDVSDLEIVLRKNLTIAGTATLTNVSINADGAEKFTVSGLNFTGDSWINCGTATTLTVSGVTANVTPTNASATNSRPAFISLGRSEQHTLALTVENCNIVTPGNYPNPILGWASITEANLIGNTFGSAEAHQWNSDSAKFMSIAEGAVFTIKNNTVYSDYNGIVFGQNTTRGNAYSVYADGNTFIGGADHIWIEVSGGSVCNGSFNITSNNTVNGEAFTYEDVKVHPIIKTWTSYAGVDVQLDANGKVNGGTLAYYAEDVIAEGCKVENHVVYRKTASVGGVDYYNISEAVANWTNGTTLILLDNATLTDTVKLKSTEHHILNLGTYTLTAAQGKNAIEITCDGRSSASYAITVNADETNPGGINAPGKACIYYSKSGSTKDRPIIRIYNGVFNGSYSINSKSNGNTNCPQIWIYGGTFNGNVNLTKNMLRVYGGTFNGWINCTGDSSAYREISGGTFKSWQFMTADADNKFWIGTSKANYDIGVYVNDNGYLVVGGAPITEAGDKFEASSMNYGGWSSYLKYSSAATYGLYYTSVYEALADNNKSGKSVTVYVSELDLTSTTYAQTINIVDTLSVTFTEGTTPAWTVASELGEVTFTDSGSDGIVTRTYKIGN